MKFKDIGGWAVKEDVRIDVKKEQEIHMSSCA
jgi:hypothetical protein